MSARPNNAAVAGSGTGAVPAIVIWPGVRVSIGMLLFPSDRLEPFALKLIEKDPGVALGATLNKTRPNATVTPVPMVGPEAEFEKSEPSID